MTRGILFVLAFSVITGLLVGGVIAGGGMSGGALESTQLMNHAELITQVSQLAEQINNQIQMIQDMITNTLALPKRLIGSVMGTVNKLWAHITRYREYLEGYPISMRSFTIFSTLHYKKAWLEPIRNG